MSVCDANGVEIRIGDRVAPCHGNSDVVYVVTRVGGTGRNAWIHHNGPSFSIVEQYYKGVLYKVVAPTIVPTSRVACDYVVLLDDPKEFLERIPV